MVTTSLVPWHVADAIPAGAVRVEHHIDAALAGVYYVLRATSGWWLYVRSERHGPNGRESVRISCRELNPAQQHGLDAELIAAWRLARA